MKGMLVTKIEELDKKRARIFLDMEFAFVLYKGELRKYGLKEGEEIGNEEYSWIVGELLPKRAKLRSMNLLKIRAYTERQLREKLQRGEYPEDSIEEAVAYVKSFGYIDDRQYAQDFIAYHMADRSGRRMEQELMAKGIRRDIIQQAMENLAEEGETPDEISVAEKILRKKNYDPETATIKEKQKLSAFLYRKGFQMDTIRSVLALDISVI